MWAVAMDLRAADADATGDGNVFRANRGCFIAQQGDEITVTLGNASRHPLDRPLQVDSRRTGGRQHGRGTVHCLPAAMVVIRCQVEAPRRGRADQRRSPDVHFADCCYAILPASEIMNAVFMRKQALIDDLHHTVVFRVRPDCPKIFELCRHGILPGR